MHMLLPPYAICLSHTHTLRVRRQTILSPTHSHVQSPSLFPWKPEGQGANERLCDCVTVTKCSPVPECTVTRRRQSSAAEFIPKRKKTGIITWWVILQISYKWTSIVTLSSRQQLHLASLWASCWTAGSIYLAYNADRADCQSFEKREELFPFLAAMCHCYIFIKLFYNQGFSLFGSSLQ